MVDPSLGHDVLLNMDAAAAATGKAGHSVTLTFASVIASAGIDAAEALVIRHAYVREQEDGPVGIHGDSSTPRSWRTRASSRPTPAPSRPRLPGFGSCSGPRAVTA